jgi:hypothetical protein
MRFDVPFAYELAYLKPRGRVPKTVLMKDSVTVEIAAYGEADAPVVIAGCFKAAERLPGPTMRQHQPFERRLVGDRLFEVMHVHATPAMSAYEHQEHDRREGWDWSEGYTGEALRRRLYNPENTAKLLAGLTGSDDLYKPKILDERPAGIERIVHDGRDAMAQMVRDAFTRLVLVDDRVHFQTLPPAIGISTTAALQCPLGERDSKIKLEAFHRSSLPVTTNLDFAFDIGRYEQALDFVALIGRKAKSAMPGIEVEVLNRLSPQIDRYDVTPSFPEARVAALAAINRTMDMLLGRLGGPFVGSANLSPEALRLGADLAEARNDIIAGNTYAAGRAARLLEKAAEQHWNGYSAHHRLFSNFAHLRADLTTAAVDQACLEAALVEGEEPDLAHLVPM